MTDYYSNTLEDAGLFERNCLMDEGPDDDGKDYYDSDDSLFENCSEEDDDCNCSDSGCPCRGYKQGGL